MLLQVLEGLKIKRIHTYIHTHTYIYIYDMLLNTHVGMEPRGPKGLSPPNPKNINIYIYIYILPGVLLIL